MSRYETFLMRVGVWCFEHAGRDTDYRAALESAGEAQRKFIDANNRRAQIQVSFSALLKTAKLTDGLLSSRRVDEAHQQLRVGIINAGGVATARKQPKPDGDA